MRERRLRDLEQRLKLALAHWPAGGPQQVENLDANRIGQHLRGSSNVGCAVPITSLDPSREATGLLLDHRQNARIDGHRYYGRIDGCLCQPETARGGAMGQPGFEPGIDGL